MGCDSHVAILLVLRRHLQQYNHLSTMKASGEFTLITITSVDNAAISVFIFAWMWIILNKKQFSGTNLLIY